MDFPSQRPLYSTDPSTKGFDLSSGKIWIYPENYPVREYQFQIVKSALYHNTLVCLPTGLGKTFIAAVVMYNFWRWYPQGKIVFLAPTKPLVAQQINACHDIMGIPSDESVELTGTTDQKKRQVAWNKYRVIFATPQVFHRDLEKKIIPSDLVKCVVVDEAHKALGKHSYCESIRLLSEQNQYFRVLALSATPGGKLDAVQEVVRNLHITHMELRDDKSPDIIPYINERKLDIILVGLGPELEGFKERYISIMDRHVRVLVENNVLRGFAGNISKGRIFHIQKEWNQKTDRGGNYGKIMKTVTILMTMYHAYELMVRHGLRAFYNFYQNHLDKFWLSDEKDLMSLLEEINYYLGPFPDVRPMPDGSVSEIPEDIRFGHNKFQKLKELLLRHFQSFEDREEETRAIVFVEYRDIVNEVYVLLLQSRPLIRPQKFVGQAGQKQRQQKLALENFRCNKVNVLISTSVGEEGLDVGEVDLIVCFDISQQSPIRLVQRMGRTGRKRDGHIVVLVTDGKEHQTLKSTMSRRDSLNNKVLQSSGIITALHEESPRMVPADFDPECQKMVMTIIAKTAPVKGKGKKKEEKKTAKNLEANSKTKNSKIAEPSISSKPGGSQSSLMRFLKKPTENPRNEDDDDFRIRPINSEIRSLSVQTFRDTQISQKSLKHENTIKPSQVLLLSSDDAAIEFLTLCALKKSKNEQQTQIEKRKTNENLDDYRTENDINGNFFDFEVPDVKILDCLKYITDCSVPSSINQKNCDAILKPSGQFNDFNTVPQDVFPQDEKNEENGKFIALLDESSSDSDVTDFQSGDAKNKDFPENEQVDWGENIDGLGLEDLLDEWSEVSPTSVEKNEAKVDKPIEINSSSINIAKKSSVFEEILECCSDESDNDCNEQMENVESESLEKKLATKNTSDCGIKSEPKNLEEKATSESPSKTTLVKELKGKFEEILLSSSDNETDDNLPNININKSKIVEIKNMPENNSELTINDKFKCTFEDILNFSDESDEQLDTKNIADDSKNAIKKVMNESKGAFEAILDDSSDGSETDFSLELAPDLPEASNKILASKENLNSRESIANDPSKNSDVLPGIELTVSQTLGEIERINSSKKIHKPDNVNSRNEGDNPNERSTSPVFPDWPRASYTYSGSRLSGSNSREAEKKLILTNSNDPIDEIAESEEDIFGTDDLIVDSDFEDEIINIEKRAVKNTCNIEKSCESNDNGLRKNSITSPVKESSNEILIEDCDWSSDFESVSSPSKPSTSFEKTTESRNLSVNVDNSLVNNDETGDKNKSKLNLSFAKKLTNNINKNLATKEKFPKASTSKHNYLDSDSENEFAVGRLENTVTKQLESDFFAKPADPVDKVTRPLDMSNPRRIIRGPLTLRRNPVGQLSINGLSTFAAPDKYTQRKETRKSLGVGRQKSASLDLDVRKKKKKHGLQRMRIRSEFIDDEAQVSSDGNHTSGSSGTDDDLNDFVSYTQHADDSVDMQAHYLQTIRSPRKPGAFIMRKPKSPSPDLEIYSQALPDEPNSYLYDSFCVAEDDEVFGDSEAPNEISILEEIERNLKRKKRKRVQSEDARPKQKRRVIARATDTSSSEDEFEKLRRQIHDE